MFGFSKKIDKASNKELAEKARRIRAAVIEALAKAGSGHTAGALGMADIFAALYFKILKHDPKNPAWQERDRLVLSNGHICPALYAAMCLAGYAPMEEFKTALRKFGSRFQGHPDRNFFPMLETSSGPLGSGLSQAVGMALAKKMDGRKEYVFCLMSDGELDEGNTWEAVMLAGKYKLGNLIAIIDRNQIQISGTTEDVMPLEPLADKWESFNWHAQEIGGHNFDEIVTAIKNAKFAIDKPSVIIAHTIPGKGVSFMENDYRWHGRAPAPKEAEKALKELS